MLSLHNIRLPLAEFTLAIDVELNGMVTAILGASGSGKTSLLDLIAGLRRPASARIVLGDRVLTDTATRIAIPTHRRAIGYVPQDLALFPHLSVRGNLLFGHRADAASAVFSLPQVVATLEIDTLLDRDIRALSGGEKQRVALARALLAAPRLLLLDEPLASLDRPLKARLVPYLRRIRDELRVPMIYVTHDPEEIAPLCDQVLRLDRGQIVPETTAA